MTSVIRLLSFAIICLLSAPAPGGCFPHPPKEPAYEGNEETAQARDYITRQLSIPPGGIGIEVNIVGCEIEKITLEQNDTVLRFPLSDVVLYVPNEEIPALENEGPLTIYLSTAHRYAPEKENGGQAVPTRVHTFPTLPDTDENKLESAFRTYLNYCGADSGFRDLPAK